jgi:diguanylate cyclase (GGDEF)-like protein/PAS domain S-box-containing protein
MASAEMADDRPVPRAAGTWLRWMNASVSQRISASVLILALLVAGGLGWGSFVLSRKLVEEGVARDLHHETTLAARQVEFTFNTLHADLSGLAVNTLFMEGITDRNIRNNYLAPFFAQYKSPTKVPTTLALYDANGQLVMGAGGAPSPSYEGATWIKRVTLLGLTHTQLETGKRGRYLVIAKPVAAGPKGAGAAMLVLRVPIAAAFRSAVASTRGDLTKELKMGSDEVLAAVGTPGSPDRIVTAQRVALDWAVLPKPLQLEMSGDREVLLEPLRLLIAGYAVAGGVMLLFVLVGARVIGRYYTRTLRRLTQVAAAALSAEAPPGPLPVKGDDEVAQLTVAFNAIAERLNTSRRDLETRVAERTVKLEDINSALVKEIMNHKKTGEQLHVAANAIENAAEGVIVCDSEGRLVSANKAFLRITGYPPEEVLGRRLEELSPPEQGMPGYSDVFELVRTQGHWKGELWSIRKNGDRYVEARSISAVRDDGGQVVNYIILCSDVTKQKEDETRLQFLAHHDPLTGLPNRTHFQQRCEEALMRAARRNAKVAVMFVDLDHFKTVNDSLGHGHGDELLRQVATRLQECTRKTDTVARLGGDEFTILLGEVADSGDIAFIAKKIADRLSSSFTIAGHEVFVSASVGISCYPEDGQSASVLIKNADAAMYAAKEQGRNNYQFFSADMNTQALEALMMASSLRLAIERDELILEYQPRLELATGRVTGAESLVRWNHPNLGRIMPSQFIGLAEKTGLIDPIGEWVLRRACEQMVEWRRTGVALPRVAVNISARQFRHPDFPERVAAILLETGMDPSSLEVEVTESMVMHDPQRTTVILERLKERNVVVAIDDFGTGYSSLSYLKRFPIDYIKIDQSFVRGIPHDAEDIGIVRAIIALAKTLDVHLIAEGIDTQEQIAFLKQEGCNEGQGYLISASLPAERLSAFIRNPAGPRAAHPAS